MVEKRVPSVPEALCVRDSVFRYDGAQILSGIKGRPKKPHLRDRVSALSSEMFLLPFFLSNLMFYLDPGLEFILHVDNFLVPVATFSLLLLLQPVLSEPQHLPPPNLSGVGMCKREPPQQAFTESDTSTSSFHTCFHPDLEFFRYVHAFL